MFIASFTIDLNYILIFATKDVMKTSISDSLFVFVLEARFAGLD